MYRRPRLYKQIFSGYMIVRSLLLITFTRAGIAIVMYNSILIWIYV